MPTLASLALATFFLLVPLTPSVASVLQVCVGPAGALLTSRRPHSARGITGRSVCRSVLQPP